ncbi:Calx-beta domain-containing protein [uncultured Croceitalea sp.]|uniref:Calx-beta domain-containing protein n=1 Tax=uncultured Croceitalea sp. TaxID=1798908 RepID=UPI0033058A31
MSLYRSLIILVVLGTSLQTFGTIPDNLDKGGFNHFLYPLGHETEIQKYIQKNGSIEKSYWETWITLAAPEICDNGLDDDGDGLTDGLDPDCPCANDPGGVFVCTPDCGVDVPDDIANFSIKETFSIPGVFGFSPVLVGDAEGDGIPDVWVHTGKSNSTEILVFDGRLQSTVPKYTISKFSAMTHAVNAIPMAIADIDNDGDMEVAFQVSGNRIEMRSHDNTFLWSTELPRGTASFIAPAFADFNHDGIPEIYVGNTIMNARTGTILVTGNTENIRNHYAALQYVTNSIAADVKLGGNGNLELIVGHTVYDVTITNTNGTSGNTIVSNAVTTGNFNQKMPDGSSYLADMDKDGLIDVVTATQNLITVWNPRTLELMSSLVTNSFNQSVLLIADFDNDGFPELSFLADREYFVAYDYDGVALTQKWGLNVRDVSSGSTGSSLFDFNGDGIQEIVYRDELSLRILRASDGSTIAQLPCSSGTQIEYPVIADIDNDGAAEIVVSCGSDISGDNGFLKVFESDLSIPGTFEWRNARNIWNQWEYRAVNINDDGTVPLTEVYSAYNNGSGGSNSQPFNLSNAQITPYLTPDGQHLIPTPDAHITEVTFDSSTCPVVGITYTVENLGSAPLPATTMISVYDGDPTISANLPNLLGTFALGATIAEGATQTLTNTIDLGTPLHVPNAHVIINDDGTHLPLPSDYNTLGKNSGVHECDYNDNVITSSFSCCFSDEPIVTAGAKNNCPSPTADLTTFSSTSAGTLRYYEDAALTTEVADPTAVNVAKDYYVTNTETNCGESGAVPISVEIFTCSNAEIEFTNTNVIVTEGTDNFARFTVRLTDVITDDVTFDYQTNSGTAENGSDFMPKMGTITFTPAINTVDIDIPITDDNTIEPQESFTLVLYNVQSNIGVGFANGQPTSTATGTIDDDDDIAPGNGIRFVDDNITVDEGAGTVTIQVTNVGTFSTNFRLSWSTNNSTPAEALDGTDYTGATGFFDFSGADGEVFDIIVAITDDLIIEDLEHFEVILSVDIPLIVPITDNTGTITIVDNDTFGPTDGLSVAGFSVPENTTGPANFTITYNGPEIQNAFTVDFDIIDGSATRGPDYTVTTTSPVTFPAGTENGDIVDVAISVIDDAIFENDEDLFITLNSLSNPLIPIVQKDATGIIADDESIGVILDLTATEVEEGGTIVFTATLSTVNNTGADITVDFTDLLTGSATSGTDYVSVPNGTTITIANGSDTGSLSIPTLVDGLFENNETLMAQISNISNPIITIGNDSATAIIDDLDDNAGIVVNLYAYDSSEGNDVIFAASLSKVNHTGSDIIVDFSDLLTGSATSGTDYTAVPDGTTIAIADGSSSGMINISTTVDGLFEGDETIIGQITGISNPVISIGMDTATAVIDDIDDDAGITLDLSATDANEGDTITFTATLSTINNTGSDITVDFADLPTGTAISGTDYAAVPPNTIITIADGSNTGTVTIATVVDGLFEGDETVIGQIANVSNPAITIGTDISTSIINDNDDAGITLDLSATDANEGNAIIFTATLSAVNNTGNDIMVDFADLLTGSATSGPDYTQVPTGSSITIAHGSNMGTIHIATNEDTVIENDETVNANIGNVSHTSVAIGINDATAMIVDNDGGSTLGVQFDTNDITVNEGEGTVSLNVVLNVDVQDEFTVEFYSLYGSATDGLDYEGVPQNSQTLTFGGANANTQIITIPIIDDIRIEATENFNVILENISTNLVSILANDTANVNIIDNDGNEEWPKDDTIEACDPIPPAEEIVSNSSCAITANLVEIIDGDTDSCPTEYAINRTWTITDCVGNVREHIQVVTVEDTVPPVFVETLPQNMTVTCDNIPQAETLTATDSCDNDVAVTFIETVSNDANCTEGYTITRTWVATDCAGNDTEHIQIITIEPTGPITIGAYDDEIIIVCGESLPPVPELVITGGCGNYAIDYDETTEFNNNTEEYMIVRTWIITDSCGNKASSRQTIFVVKPELEEVFIDICVEDEPIDLLNYLPEGFESAGTFEAERPGTYLIHNIFEPSGLEIGEYKVSYTSTNGSCRYNADFYVTVNTDCIPCSNRDDITVSETVTVNGDGINDFFEIKSTQYCVLTFDVMIFNRWGDKVFEQNDYQNDWGGFAPDGSFGTSGLLPAGTYYYIINVNGVTMEPINGYIYLGTE